MIRLHKFVRIVKLYIALCATMLAINITNASMTINQFKAFRIMLKFDLIRFNIKIKTIPLVTIFIRVMVTYKGKNNNCTA